MRMLIARCASRYVLKMESVLKIEPNPLSARQARTRQARTRQFRTREVRTLTALFPPQVP